MGRPPRWVHTDATDRCDSACQADQLDEFSRILDDITDRQPTTGPDMRSSVAARKLGAPASLRTWRRVDDDVTASLVDDLRRPGPSSPTRRKTASVFAAAWRKAATERGHDSGPVGNVG